MAVPQHWILNFSTVVYLVTPVECVLLKHIESATDTNSDNEISLKYVLSLQQRPK